MATTYEAIATVTVGSGGAASITFSSIPATYTDLYVALSHRTEAGIDGFSYALLLKINTVTINRTWRRLEAYDGSSVYSDNGTGAIIGLVQGDGTTANTFNSFGLYIPNYANTSYNKSLSVDTVTENNAGGGQGLDFIAGLWSSTAAIDSLEFYTQSPTPGDFAQYSTATLYGIKNS